MSGTEQSRSYLVECYWPGVTEAKLAAAVERAQQAADGLRRRGHQLRFLGSILVPADETVFCLFNGSEADVRTVTEESGVPYERILESLRIGGNDRAKEEE